MAVFSFLLAHLASLSVVTSRKSSVIKFRLAVPIRAADRLAAREATWLAGWLSIKFRAQKGKQATRQAIARYEMAPSSYVQ